MCLCLCPYTSHLRKHPQVMGGLARTARWKSRRVNNGSREKLISSGIRSKGRIARNWLAVQRVQFYGLFNDVVGRLDCLLRDCWLKLNNKLLASSATDETKKTVWCRSELRARGSLTLQGPVLYAWAGIPWYSDSLRAVKVRISNPGGDRRFSSAVQTGPEDHPAYCTIVTGFLSRG